MQPTRVPPAHVVEDAFGQLQRFGEVRDLVDGEDHRELLSREEVLFTHAFSFDHKEGSLSRFGIVQPGDLGYNRGSFAERFAAALPSAGPQRLPEKLALLVVAEVAALPLEGLDHRLVDRGLDDDGVVVRAAGPVVEGLAYPDLARCFLYVRCGVDDRDDVPRADAGVRGPAGLAGPDVVG